MPLINGQLLPLLACGTVVDWVITNTAHRYLSIRSDGCTPTAFKAIMTKDNSKDQVLSVDVEKAVLIDTDDLKKDLTVLEEGDAVLARKMYLVNNAIDEIGFTWFHFKIFCIAGFGYAADTLIGMAQSTVVQYVNYQFNQKFYTIVEAQYAGLFAGCIFWTFSSDLIGRKLAFNVTLLFSSLFGLLVGGMSSLATYCIMLVISCFLLGGNLAIDATVFLEFLPSKYQVLTTGFACWWSLGQIVGYLVAYAFYTNEKYYCSSYEDCPSPKNRGWRYVWYIDSGIVLGLALGRLFVRLQETPKYLITVNKDEEAVTLLKKIAKKYNRTCSLEAEDLLQCGRVEKNSFDTQHASIRGFVQAAAKNLRALFVNRLMTRNMVLLIVGWFGVGFAYPLWGQFLPVITANATKGETVEDTYTDSLVSTTFSILGPLFASGLILIPRIGRRGTLVIGGLLSMTFFMASTSVTTRLQNVAFSSVFYITMYIYYATLYGFTPESLPAYCRGTGSGVAIVFNRLGGLLVPLVEYFADPTTQVPIWVCAAFFGLMGLLAFFFPFEPSIYRTV